ncbi:hypothetical protein BC826DRAFT_1177567 [Russula brevipes]|nr:hypothetical protein BC826DRAFT_1177567 [Russula brevipes]
MTEMRIDPACCKPIALLPFSPPALTTTASSRVRAPVRYGAAPPELPRPYDERSAKGYAEERRYANPSAASHKQQSPPVPTVSPVGHPSRPQPASEPCRLDKDHSRNQGIEGIDREVKRPTDEPTSDEMRRWRSVSDERATHRNHSVSYAGAAHRRKAEPNPTNSHALDTVFVRCGISRTTAGGSVPHEQCLRNRSITRD